MEKKEWSTKTFSENFENLLKINGKTQRQIAKDLGVSAPTVHDWIHGIKMPRMKHVNAIANLFGVSITDLISQPAARINVYGSVPAGIPLNAIQYIEEWEDIPREWVDGGVEYIALKVHGDSMSPKYLSGDIIIVKIQPDCETGQDAVVYVNGYDATLKRVIKQIDGIMLQPLNPAYEPHKYDYNDPINPVSILGVVVEIRRTV